MGVVGSRLALNTKISEIFSHGFRKMTLDIYKYFSKIILTPLRDAPLILTGSLFLTVLPFL